MSARHLLNNAQDGNFEAAVQVFLNYKNGTKDFEKSEEKTQEAFEAIIKILDLDFFLNTLNILNFKKISDLKINFNKNLTVFLGENGVGKTSLLEAIRKNLMWIAATTRKENSNGGTIDKDEINNHSKDKGAFIDCEFQIGDSYKFKGRIARSPEGITSDLKSELTQYRTIGRYLRILNEYRSLNLPLLAFYGVDRLPKDVAKAKFSDSDKIDGYDGSLNSKASFNIFSEWLIKLLKTRNSVVENTEKLKVQTQVDFLLQTGADKKDHPMNELYEELIAVLKLYPDNIRNKSKSAIGFLEELFRKIYPNLSHIELINEDDGNDKVACYLKDEIIFLHQFSDGQRVLLGLIGDIARRLLLLNDTSDLPFRGRGVVLIDEVELHLHPSWQQKIILILRESFPNIQFIVTTHSPHVITTVEPECIRSIYIDLETNKFGYDIPTFTKGAESNVVLEDVFDVDARPEWLIESTEWLKKYTDLVNKDLWDSDEAIDLRKKLDAWGKNKETELDKLDVEISLRSFKRSKK